MSDADRSYRSRVQVLKNRVLQRRAELGLMGLKYGLGENGCNEEDRAELTRLKRAMARSLRHEDRLNWIGFKMTLADAYGSVRDRLAAANAYIEMVRPYFA